MILTFIQIKDVVPYVVNKYSVHAEQSCIRKVKDKSILKYCTLILVLVSSDTRLIECCSCSKCRHIITKYSISKTIVYYN